MSKPTILVQLDTDAQPSVFDSVVAVDAGATQLFRHGGVNCQTVRGLVHGAMFTRGGDDLRHTALFIGGSVVADGEQLLVEIVRTFFGPVRVSVMLDSNGANTTAAAAVLAAAKHLPLPQTTALVLGGTGPVGQRVARLLAGQGSQVRLASRTADKARAAVEAIVARLPQAQVQPVASGSPPELTAALAGCQLVVAAGAAGVELLPAAARTAARTLQVAIDLNAVPPAGIAGVAVTDKAQLRDGQTCYGALGVGGTKMKIHKAAIQRLFTRNDLVLDAEEIFQIGRELTAG